MKPVFHNVISGCYKKIIEFLKGLSISNKFVIIYVTVFAIPIFLYALYSFHNANEDVKAEFFEKSRDELNEVYENILGNIKACKKLQKVY